MIKSFIEKLRALPEAQRKMIFLMVMTIVAMIMIFTLAQSTKNNVTQVQNSIRSIDFPEIPAPNFGGVSDSIYNESTMDISEEIFLKMDGDGF